MKASTYFIDGYIYYFSILLMIVTLFRYWKRVAKYKLDIKRKISGKVVSDFLLIIILTFFFSTIGNLFFYKSITFTEIPRMLIYLFRDWKVLFYIIPTMIFSTVLIEELSYRYLFSNLFYEIVNNDKKEKIIPSILFSLLYILIVPSLFVPKSIGLIITYFFILSTIFLVYIIKCKDNYPNFSIEKFIVVFNVILFVMAHSENYMITLHNDGFTAMLYQVLSMALLTFVLIKVYLIKRSIIYPIWIHLWWNIWIYLPIWYKN